MTKKEWLAQAKQKVDDTLSLLQSHEYVRLDYDKETVFFYKQINPVTGVLVYFANAKNRLGKENKHYELQCFDLFLHSTTNVIHAVHQYFRNSSELMEFWIPCLNPYNDKHLAVLESLNNETETNPDRLNEKYKELSGRNF